MRSRRQSPRPEAGFVAQARAEGEIDGLDWDPFLNSQDPCNQYEVRKVTKKGLNYLVEILGTGGCEEHTKPDIVAELTQQNGTWVFVNFRDSAGPGDDLLSALKRLHPDTK